MSENVYSAVKCGKCGATGVRLYRPGGEFRRPERDRCQACVTPEQWGWYVPLVLDSDGEAWGYTSAPQADIDEWRKQPEIEATHEAQD